MEVKLRRVPWDWVRVLVAIATLGLFPLMRRFGRRRMIWRMEDRGFQTRSGKLIAWTAVTRVRRVRATLGEISLLDEFRLSTRYGRAFISLRRAAEPDAVCKYLLLHLPPGVEPT
jgi:hypothetical protein